jgi:hypothetical protein
MIIGFRRKCSHVWRRTADGGAKCERCNRVRDPAAARTGRVSRKVGDEFEREVAAILGLRAVGRAGGPEDLVGDTLTAQAKCGARFPGWLWDALPPASGGRMRAVIVGDAPPAKGGRVFVCIPLEDFARGPCADTGRSAADDGAGPLPPRRRPETPEA